jgi:hypothetical protein
MLVKIFTGLSTPISGDSTWTQVCLFVLPHPPMPPANTDLCTCPCLVSSNASWEVIQHSSFPEQPAARYGHSAVSHQDTWIIFGGKGVSDLFNNVWQLSFVSQTCCRLTCTGTCSSPCRNHLATLAGDLLFIYGGYNNGGDQLTDIFVLDLQCRR